MLWVRRDIEAPPAVVWELLTAPEHWPEWGPSVTAVDLDADQLRKGARGTVTTKFGLDLPFEIVEFDDGIRWAWKVGGVPATDHVLEPLGSARCRVGFGVPWPASPYLAVCRVALARLERLAETIAWPRQ